MNIFEGARRIAKIIYVFSVFLGLIFLTQATPSLYRYYEVKENGELKQVDDCGTEEWFTAKVKDQPTWASVFVCGWDDGPEVVALKGWELEKLEDAVFQARIESYGEIIFGIVAVPAGLFILFWAVGWIVRGFLGIPRGHDHQITTIEVEK